MKFFLRMNVRILDLNPNWSTDSIVDLFKKVIITLKETKSATVNIFRKNLFSF